MSDDVKPVKVEVVNQTPVSPKKETRLVITGYVVTAGDNPVEVLSHAPKRTYAEIHFYAAASALGYLATSRADVQALNGSIVQNGQFPVKTAGTNSVWFTATNGTMYVNVFADYEQ